MKKLLCLLMMVGLAAFLSMAPAGCQQQGPTGVDEPEVEEDFDEEGEALEEAIGEEEAEEETTEE